MNFDVDPDYELRGAHRASSKPRSNRIPIEAAREAYDRLHNWRLVAQELARQDGTKFQPHSIVKAVRYADRDFAGRLVGGR